MQRFLPAGVLVIWSCLTAHCRADRPLLEVDEQFDIARVQVRDATLNRHGKVLKLVTGHKTDWPGITVRAPGGPWDLSAYNHLAVDVKNVGTQDVRIGCRVDGADSKSPGKRLTTTIALSAGRQATMVLPLTKLLPDKFRSKMFGMRGYPGGWHDLRGIDTRQVTELSVFVVRPTVDHHLEISNIRAVGKVTPLPDDLNDLFPIVDRYGQYIHRDWTGKTASDKDLAQRAKEEATDLTVHGGPKDWNQYGGWQAGPQLEATGRFRTTKHDGKWWLVDPAGRLFWSHGIDCIRSSNAVTPITDRRHYFAALPAADSPLAQFYGAASKAPRGYYQGKRFETFNFTASNLLRKYGSDWPRRSTELAHRRLRSWGMNTFGSWSDPEIYRLRRTPYVVYVGTGGKRLTGSSGFWKQFPDVFDPGFEPSLQKRLAQEKRAAADPWCIGYFVDNELSWGSETSLATATLASPANQAAKLVFVGDLRKKYGSIEKLNAAWGTTHASWDTLLSDTTPPAANKAQDDLKAFYTKTAERYFRVCRDAVKQADPTGLYLGCRFAWVNDRAARAAGRFCDVVSYNRYRPSVADFRLPEGMDKPVVIGEFHFGALDRGPLHTGLGPVANQAARAEAYRSYVHGALQNPTILGTHWFQYGDQATTGRFDGENYQIGFLDVCDSPYRETIKASRAVGKDMYQIRHGAGIDP